MKDFVHLHLHSEYSFLDGMCRAEEIAESTRRMKMPAVAITDHGNLHGVVSFYEAAWKHGVKPIIGSEMYLAPGNRKETRSKSGEENFFHLTILAKDQEGYQNLVMLSTLSWLEGFYYKPRIDRLLSRYANGFGF